MQPSLAQLFAGFLEVTLTGFGGVLSPAAPLAVGVTIVTALILLRSSAHPLLLMAGGAVLGLAGVV